MNPFENLASQRYSADERLPAREAGITPSAEAEAALAGGPTMDALQAGNLQPLVGPPATPTPKDGPESLRWVWQCQTLTWMLFSA